MLIPVAVLVTVLLVTIAVNVLGYEKVRIGSQSALPDYTVVAKKVNCSAPPGAPLFCDSYSVKLVLNGRVKEYWLSESDEACYEAAHDGAILRASCWERLRIKGSRNQFHIPQ